MKKTVKQMIAVLLTMLLVCSVMPLAFAYTVSSGTVGSLTWTLDSNGTLTVSGNGAMPDYDQLPQEKFPWDAYRTQIKKVIIGIGVTAIGNSAFGRYGALKEASIANTVQAIGDYAFYDCDSLATLSVPNSVKAIGVDSFRDCSNLKNVSLGNGLEELSWRSFASCESLTSLTIPGSLKEMGFETFEDCTSLASVTIENGVKEICKYAFWGCSNLKTVNLPDTLETIMGAAFFQCGYLNNVTLPEGLKEISAAAFCECTSLESIKIPKSTRIVDYMSFNGCIAMRDFTVLNPSCLLNGPFELVPEDKGAEVRLDYIWSVPAYSHYKLTVHGYAGSTAETYAKQTNKNFAVLQESQTDILTIFTRIREIVSALIQQLKPILENLFSALMNNAKQTDTTQPTQQGQAAETTNIIGQLLAGLGSILAQAQKNATAA